MDAIASRSRLLVLLVVLLLAGIVVALVQGRTAERSARLQIQQTTQVLNLLRQALRTGLDAETGQRGFLLTGEASYLTPYERARRIWLARIDAIGLALADKLTPTQATRLARLRTIAVRKLALMVRTIVLVQNGRRREAMAVVASDRGQSLMREFRLLINELEDEEQVILNRTLAKAEAVDARTLPILLFLGIAVAALMVLAFQLQRWNTQSLAVTRDADELFKARQQSDLLARELNHRVKNLFAVILSIVSLSGRNETDPKRLVKRLRERIHALSLAHSVSQGKMDTTRVSLEEIIEATLRPYNQDSTRVVLNGPDIELPVKAITPIGLIMHELATNAAKYGALSTERGLVDIAWRISTADEIELTWRELEGPTLSSTEGDESGFGTVMMQQAAKQLGGSVERNYESDGMVARITFPASGPR